MPAHAILSLRGRKYGEEWAGVWEYLEQTHDFRPMELDDAVDLVVGSMKDRHAMHPQRNATVLELIRDADRIGLRQDHLKRLAGVVAPDEELRGKVLQGAAEHLGWDTDNLRDWESVAEDGDIESLVENPTPTLLEDVSGDAHTQFASAMSSLGLLADKTHLDVPSCSSVNVPGGQDGATTVYGEFVIDAVLDDLRFATDPENWPYCSWFFIAMTKQGPKVKLDQPDDQGVPVFPAYQTVFNEVVGIKNVLTVSTWLTTRYFVGTESVGMEFDLTPGVHGDGKLDVDHGYLLAEKHPTQAGKVVVKSQKTFSFVGLDDLPFSFLCEFGWIDMMRAMAQCRKPAGGGP